MALSSSIGRLWKTSELDLLSSDRDLRFLGCEISASEDGHVFYIHQWPYIEEILRHHEVPSTTLSYVQAPREMVNFEAFEDEEPGTEAQVKAAQRLCGELLWLAQQSRPDISYVVSAMGSLLSRAAARCSAIGMRLLAYLQQTKHLALAMRATSDELIAFSDSSFAPQGTRSFTGVVLSWKGSPVTWRAAKQPFTCLSTAECELVASIEALTMAKSLEAVIRQLDACERPIVLGIDNQAASAIAQPSSTASWRTRHLRVKASFIHEQVISKQVVLRYVPGKQQWADLLTKSFPKQRLCELLGLWGFIDRANEVARTAVMKAMLMCLMIQATRAQDHPEPLAINTSVELYVMVVVLGIAVVGLWEFLWLCVDRCCSKPEETRSARRMRRLQVAVQRELEVQMGGLEESLADSPVAITSTPVPTTTTSTRRSTPRPKPMSRRSTARSSTDIPVAPQAYATVTTTAETGVQTDLQWPPPRPLICYQDRAVPTPVPDPSGWNYPLYVSPHGDTYHTYESCWGLRNTKPRAVRFCACCRENHGKSLRDR